ncbi:reverse transcriptase domain-containing protein [Tanacetum coccineum]|uniref:Reverse transcriptase domain-containing protein n=1 Tax=Tanacetum coccineum TaxID=301880 RepID=A0ABQ5DNQ8_9ASTR
MAEIGCNWARIGPSKSSQSLSIAHKWAVNEGLQAFMDRFKPESSHIKGVPSVLRISAFMHGHGLPELAKKLNDKIPQMVDEMFERVRAFIRGEVAVGSAEMVRPSQGDKGYVRPAWPGMSEKKQKWGRPKRSTKEYGDASAKLTRTELNKRSGYAYLLKNKSGSESPPEFRRSWYVEGHIESGVISSILTQWHLRNNPTKGNEGPSSEGTKLSSIFITTEHDQQAKMKATPRKLAYADSDKEAMALSLAKRFSNRFSLESSGTSDTYGQTRSASKSQKTPSRNKEPVHLRMLRRLEDRSITKVKVRKERSKSKRKRSGHQEASSNSEYEEGGASRNWFNDLGPKSVDSFDELSQKFLEEYSQQKRYAKDPTEIHGIKRRQNEGLQAFMDGFKSESSHIKGVPPVLRVSAFMNGHGHPELAKKLNDKIP